MNVNELMAPWRTVSEHKLFSHPDDRSALSSANARFPKNRVPEPWFGNPSAADIFVLTLNPGHRDEDDSHTKMTHDFFWRMIAGNSDYADYRNAISQAGLSWGIRTYGDFLPYAMSRICNLRLVAYPSPQKADMGILSGNPALLPTTRLMLEFVHERLVPRARSGKCLLLVMRSPMAWGFGTPERDVWQGGLFVSRPLRTASISPGSRVGSAIMDRLQRY